MGSKRRTTTTQQPAPHRAPRWLLGAILAATIVAYAPAIRAPFVMDDVSSIAENQSVRALWPISIALHPPLNTSVQGRPVANYSLALNYWVNNLLHVDQPPSAAGANETVSYHALNLLLHLSCGLLLFGIVRRTLRTGQLAERWATTADTIAAVVSGVWLLHPIQTEALNYLVQRTELLASACYLLTLYAAVRAWDAGATNRAIAWRVLSVGAYALGLGSKEVAITAPLIVLLYDRAFRVASWKALLANRPRAIFYGALALCATAALGLFATRSRFGTVGFDAGLSWYRYLYSQAWAILHYLRLVVWPNALTIDYGYRPIGGWRGVPGVIVLVALLAGTLVAWAKAERWAWLGFLGAWFFLVIAPSSSIVPIATEIAAERRIYLALASVVVLVAVVVNVGWNAYAPRLSGARRNAGRAAWVVVTAVLVAMAVTTFTRSALYADPEALWRDAVRKQPDNARAYINLATVLGPAPARLVEGDSLYTKAIAVDSTVLDGWSGLALARIREGKPREAILLLQRVLRINPDYVEGIDRLGKVLLQTGDPEGALPYVKRLADASPTDTRLVELADVYLRLGRPQEAELALRRALAANAERPEALGLLGGLLVDQNRGAEAVPYLEEAVRVDRGWGVSIALLGVAYAEAGRPTDAEGAARAAAERANGDPAVFVDAGRSMLIAKQPAEAEGYLVEAVRLAPSDPDALRKLAAAEAALGKQGDAKQLLNRARALEAGGTGGRARDG